MIGAWAVLWAIASLFHDPSAVTHECALPTTAGVRVSPSLSHVVFDRRLLIASSGCFYRPSSRRSTSASVVALLLLLGGVEANPGPSSTTYNGVAFGLLNARSAVHKAALIHDVICYRKLDVLALTETWITSDAPDAIKLDVGLQVDESYFITFVFLQLDMWIKLRSKSGFIISHYDLK